MTQRHSLPKIVTESPGYTKDFNNCRFSTGVKDPETEQIYEVDTLPIGFTKSYAAGRATKYTEPQIDKAVEMYTEGAKVTLILSECALSLHQLYGALRRKKISRKRQEK